MQITAQMHFEKALRQLRERGVEVGDLTPGEVFALCEACRRCASPFSDVDAELAERPVFVCRGVWLWPLTAGAQVWLSEYAAKWWRRESLRWRWAQVYALRHARERDAFVGLTDRWRAEAAVLRCALTLPVHGEELTAAMARAYGIDPHALRSGRASRPRRAAARRDASPHPAPGARHDFASLVARLEVESGIPRETWLWGRSLGYMLKAYYELHAFAAAYARDGQARERMRDELDEAMGELAKVRAAIVRRVLGSKESEAERKKADGGGDDAEADREVAEGEAAGGGGVLDEQPAGHPDEEGVVGGGGPADGAVVHDGGDYSTSRE